MKFVDYFSFHMRTYLIVVSGFSLVLGVLVLIGWHIHSVALIQILPTLVPMQYNTALGFLLSGLMLLALVKSMPRLAIIFGSIVFVIGTLTMTQYILGIDFGIDQLLMNSYITVQTTHPGRMALNTALSFSLTGLAVVLSEGLVHRKGALINGMIGSLIAAMGAVSILGYAMELEAAYGWGDFSSMAPLTAIGFIAVGFGLVIYACQRERANGVLLPEWIPISVGIGVSTITIVVWQALHPDRNVAELQSAHILVLLFGITLAGALALAIKKVISEKTAKLKLEAEITERIAADEKLAESQRRLSLALQGTTDCLFDWNFQSGTYFFSRYWKALLGYAEEELLDQQQEDWENRVHPDDRDQLLAKLDKFRYGKRNKFTYEYRLRHKDGHYLDIHLRALVVRDENGTAIRIVGTNADISEFRALVRTLSEQVGYVSLLVNISARLINLPSEQLSQELDYTLKIIGGFLNADFLRITYFNDAQSNNLVSNSWSAEGGQDNVGQTGSVIDSGSRLIQKVLQGATIVFNDIEEVANEFAAEKEHFLQHGIRSIAITPLQASNQEIGYVFVATTKKIASWSGENTARFKLLAEILAGALMRVRAEQELKLLSEKFQQENVYLREEIQITGVFEKIVGDSSPLLQVLRGVEQVAPTNTSVLILGESGTGKEQIAHAIHEHSKRNEQPFIKLNCAALVPSLLESELFGHEKGAFTGATQSRKGRFELADGGTLFLDEVGEMDITLQAKLLRVLQEGEFERLGSTRTQTVDVRLVAATNRDLEKEVREGRFREDLFYRLNVFPLTMPLLRDRIQDIPALVAHFLQHFNKELGKDISEIPTEVMARLQTYEWPGNIRELRNMIERAVIVSSGSKLLLQESAFSRALKVVPDSTGKSLAQIEKEHIIRVLQQHEWRIEGDNGAARILDINPATLRSRMKKMGIKRPI